MLANIIYHDQFPHKPRDITLEKARYIKISKVPTHPKHIRYIKQEQGMIFYIGKQIGADHTI